MSLVCIVLDPWWVCFLNYSPYFTFQKAFCTPFAVGIIWCTFCSSLWVDDLCYIPQWRPNLLYCSDIYYLALSKDPPTTKILVYTVYVAELVQVILYSRMAFKEFAVGFGIFEVLNKIGDLWFAVPILSSTGMFFGRCRLLTYKWISGICGPGLLRI